MREPAGGCYPPETQRSAPALRAAPQWSRVRISASARLQSKPGRAFAPSRAQQRTGEQRHHYKHHDGRVSSTRLLHSDGRHDRFGAGSNGSSTAHCASVRSNRPVTARVSTMSRCQVFLVDEQSAGDLAQCRSPTLPNSVKPDFDTGPGSREPWSRRSRSASHYWKGCRR